MSEPSWAGPIMFYVALMCLVAAANPDGKWWLVLLTAFVFVPVLFIITGLVICAFDAAGNAITKSDGDERLP